MKHLDARAALVVAVVKQYHDGLLTQQEAVNAAWHAANGTHPHSARR